MTEKKKSVGPKPVRKAGIKKTAKKTVLSAEDRKKLRDAKKRLARIEKMVFEQSFDGDMRCINLVMPKVDGLKAMYLTGVDAQKMQLRFIMMAAASVCKSVGRLTLCDEIYNALKLILSRIDAASVKGDEKT